MAGGVDQPKGNGRPGDRAAIPRGGFGEAQGSEARAAEVLDIGPGQTDIVKQFRFQIAQRVSGAARVVPLADRGDQARKGTNGAVDRNSAERRNGRGAGDVHVDVTWSGVLQSGVSGVPFRRSLVVR